MGEWKAARTCGSRKKRNAVCLGKVANVVLFLQKVSLMYRSQRNWRSFYRALVLETGAEDLTASARLPELIVSERYEMGTLVDVESRSWKRGAHRVDVGGALSAHGHDGSSPTILRTEYSYRIHQQPEF
jgi:hypothetical protein